MLVQYTSQLRIPRLTVITALEMYSWNKTDQNVHKCTEMILKYFNLYIKYYIYKTHLLRLFHYYKM